MINFRVKESDIQDLFEVEFVVDTGTTVATVNPGLVEYLDIERMLDDVQEQINLIRERIF